MRTIKIEDKFIGKDHPAFIVAEAGCNHEGSLELAKRLVDGAADAGADAVKFQHYEPEKLVTKTVPYFWVNHSHDLSPSDLDFEFNVFCWGCSFDHQSLDAQDRVKKSNIFYDLG